MNPDLMSRFWSKVNKTSGCWIWTGFLIKSRGKGTYGRIAVGGKVNKLTHRLSWEFHFSEIPDGLMVLHSCDNPACVRPDHLFLGTQMDNMHDMQRKGRERKSHGSAHHSAKLNEHQVAEIRKRYIKRKAGSYGNGTELAKEFCVSHALIYQIVKNKSWRIQ